jgi:hypothetical protein
MGVCWEGESFIQPTKNLPASVRFIFLLHKRLMSPIVKIKDCPAEKAEMQ